MLHGRGPSFGVGPTSLHEPSDGRNNTITLQKTSVGLSLTYFLRHSVIKTSTRPVFSVSMLVFFVHRAWFCSCSVGDTTSTPTEHTAPVDSIRGLTGPMRWEWEPGLFEDMVPIDKTRWRTRPDCVCAPVSELAHGLLDFG